MLTCMSWGSIFAEATTKTIDAVKKKIETVDERAVVSRYQEILNQGFNNQLDKNLLSTNSDAEFIQDLFVQTKASIYGVEVLLNADASLSESERNRLLQKCNVLSSRVATLAEKVYEGVEKEQPNSATIKVVKENPKVIKALIKNNRIVRLLLLLKKVLKL